MLEVHVNCPTSDAAATLAREAVEQRLAACANIHGAVQSYYWWDGKVQSEDEVPVVFKTTDATVDALVRYIAERHPYDTPGIVTHRPAGGHAAYLAWVEQETRRESP